MRKTGDDRKGELIEALASARRSILTAVECMAPGQGELPCIGRWCVKDLLAHLIGWDYANLEAVQKILAGNRPRFFEYFDTDWHTYNEQLVSQYRKGSIEALLADAEESHQRLVAFLQSLTPGQLLTGASLPENGRPVRIRTLLRAEIKDELEHAAQVRKFLEKDRAL